MQMMCGKKVFSNSCQIAQKQKANSVRVCKVLQGSNLGQLTLYVAESLNGNFGNQ